jgi:hypothetical protein
METTHRARSGCHDVGFRRLDYVRFCLEDAAVRAEAVGILHRLPRVVPIPLSMATRLVREGASVVVEDHRSPTGTAESVTIADGGGAAS